MYYSLMLINTLFEESTIVTIPVLGLPKKTLVSVKSVDGVNSILKPQCLSCHPEPEQIAGFPYASMATAFK